MRVVSAKKFSALCISPDRNAWASYDQRGLGRSPSTSLKPSHEMAKNNSQKNILIISNIYRYNFMNKMV